MTDRPPAERDVDPEHGDECRSVWADDRVCDCGAETIRDLRAEVERLQDSIYAERKEREVWAARARDYCKSWDDSRAAAERLQTVAFQAQNAAIDLAQQVATLTAERDALEAALSVAADALEVHGIYIANFPDLDGCDSAHRALRAAVVAARGAIRARGAK